MNILVVSQHYYPENFRITDICETLVENGNNVTVICGYPNYPEGKIYSDYKGKNKKKHKNEVINGVNVKRCFEIARGNNAIKLFMNYYSVCLSMKRKAKRIREKFDIVLINQLSPVMQANAGIAYAKKHGVSCLLYCYDLWPASLMAGGIKEGSFVYNHYYKVSNKIYKSVDKIMCTSKRFIDYFSNIGIDRNKLFYLPQYCEDIFINNGNESKNKDEYNYVFAGNVGKVQSVETIVKACNKIKDDKSIKVHIVGDGSNLENCKKLAKEYKLDNIQFYGKRPIEEMPRFYSMADAMLVTLSSNKIISNTLPGKVQSYMCFGKPIIASIDGETQDVLKEAKCAMYTNSEDYEGLSKLFIEFKNVDLNEMSINSRKYYNDNYRKDIFFSKLTKQMEDLIK